MTEQKGGFGGLGPSSRYITGWENRAERGEKKTYTAARKEAYKRRQQRAYSNEISPVLASILAGAPGTGVGVPRNTASCYQDVTTPWNAFMRCEITDENLQLALAAMLGSSIWGNALTEASRRNGMSIQQFLETAFDLASKKSQELKSPADWQNLYTSEPLLKRRQARVSRSNRRGAVMQPINPLFGGIPTAPPMESVQKRLRGL